MGVPAMTEPEEWLDAKREAAPLLITHQPITYRPYSLWLVAAVVFVATVFGVAVAELAIWWGGR